MKYLILLALLVLLQGCGSTRTVIVPEVKMPAIPAELKTEPLPLKPIKPVSD